MKNILLSLAVLLAAVGFTACSDDTDNPYDHTPTISVVSSNLVFTASASTGSAVFASNGGTLTTRLNSSWASATVSGDTVKVAVDENDDLNGRSAQMTVFNGTDSVNVTIQQQGLIFRLNATSIVAGDAAKRISYGVTANVTPVLSTSDDWFNAEISGDSLIVNLTENTTGHVRSGYVYYTAGTKRDSISVAQGEFDKDIAGKWYLVGSNLDDAIGVTLTRDGSNYYMVLDDLLGWTVPVTYNADNLSLSLSAGDSIGSYRNYIIAPTLWDTEEGYLTWSTTVSCTGTFTHVATDGYTYLTFQDNGSWGTYTVRAIRFEAFTGRPFGSSTRYGSLLSVVTPTLVRYDN